MKKSVILLFALLVLSISLTACSGKDKTVGNLSESVQEDKFITSHDATESSWEYDEYTYHIELSLRNMPYDNNGVLEIPSEINGKPVTHIKKQMFDETYYVDKLILPDKLVYIDDYAFSSLSPVNDVVIPDTLKETGVSVFENARHQWYKNLTEEFAIVGDGLLIKYNGEHNDFYFEGSETNITIPEGVKSIGGSVFSGMYITSVNFPSTLEIIGAGAFSGNFTLKSIIVPSNVERISYGAFSGCGLEEVVFNEGLKVIEGKAFAENKLKEVTLPESLDDLYSNVFASPEPPQTVTFLGNPARCDFSGLEETTILIPKNSELKSRLEKTEYKYEIIQ